MAILTPKGVKAPHQLNGVRKTRISRDRRGIGSSEKENLPVGTIVPYLGTTDTTDKKWLICDGRDTTGTAIELETHYPSLYLLLGGTNVLPDLREIVLVGAGKNDTDNIATHDIYTVGEFKDDQIQTHGHFIRQSTSLGGSGDVVAYGGAFTGNNYGAVNTISGARYGSTTHGKQKGVNYIIKAISSED